MLKATVMTLGSKANRKAFTKSMKDGSEQLLKEVEIERDRLREQNATEQQLNASIGTVDHIVF